MACDYLRSTAADKLSNLFPGSWIQHNFGIWIGHADAIGLNLLDQPAATSSGPPGGGPAERIEEARRELLIAEGSDWFWWFGDSHTSAQDRLFDRLFRKHLQNVYTLLGDEPHGELARPITQGFGLRQYSQPTGLLNVKVDGRRTYFEWLNAGQYACQGSRGAMSMAAGEGLIQSLFFGFESARLAIRLDARAGPFRERLGAIDALRLAFYSPEGYELRVANLSGKRPSGSLLFRGKPVPGRPSVAADLVFEAAIPLENLNGPRKTRSSSSSNCTPDGWWPNESPRRND